MTDHSNDSLPINEDGALNEVCPKANRLRSDAKGTVFCSHLREEQHGKYCFLFDRNNDHTAPCAVMQGHHAVTLAGQRIPLMVYRKEGVTDTQEVQQDFALSMAFRGI